MRGLLFALLGLVALAAAQSAAANDARTRDVCIIGGGASGMASAVFLKDRGYDVLVLEVAERVGGHCDTVRTGAPLFSPTGDLLYPGYTDVGVVVYQDTKRANDSTPPLPPGSKGTWSLDSRAFASRFAQTVPLDFTSTERRGANAGTLYVDLNLGIAAPNPHLSEAELQAIQAAIGAAVGRIYATTLQYPWLNTGKRPDPLPSFFLEPFTNFIRNNSLEILIQPLFFGLLTGGGMGTLSLLTTVEALQVLAPVTLDLFQQAGSGFVVAGGCQTLYDSIAAYVGANNIRLKADIRGVHRAGSRVVISGFYGDGKRFQNGRPLDYKGDDVEEDSAEDPADGGNKKGTPFVYQCRKLIMGIYPVLPNLNMLDLSNEEYALFSQMEANYYMAIAVNATGGSLANSGFTLNNVNFLNQPTQESLLPSLSTLTRSFPAGPIAAYVNSDSEVPLTYDQALKLATDGFAKIPTDLLNGFSIVSVSYHLYDPHFKPAALAATPSADTRLAKLQGKQNTFWVGAGTRYDASSVVWNQAFELVSANFPPKN